MFITDSYGWKKSTEPDDVMNFLNGTGAYKTPVKEAQICAVWKGTHIEFYVFYQKGTASEPANGWGWKKSTEPDDVMNFLNGTGAYKTPVKEAQICAVWKETYIEFYVFYKKVTIIKATWKGMGVRKGVLKLGGAAKIVVNFTGKKQLASGVTVQSLDQSKKRYSCAVDANGQCIVSDLPFGNYRVYPFGGGKLGLIVEPTQIDVSCTENKEYKITFDIKRLGYE